MGVGVVAGEGLFGGGEEVAVAVCMASEDIDSCEVGRKVDRHF